MADLEPFFVGKTFDDFLFRPQHTPVSTRRGVSLAMPLVKGLDLALPVLGANMDTVVGEEMAKTLALEGGIGFLHRNSSIAEQAARVRYVKTRHSYVIEGPLFLERTATIAEARQAIRKHNASSFLIEEVKGGGRLAGILSHRDMPLDAASDARPVSDFMTPRQRLVTRPPSVSLEEAERAMFEHRVEKLPLVDEQGRVRGLVTMRDLKLYKQKPHSTKDARGRLRVGAAVGATGDFLERSEALLAQEVDVLLLDVAHADSDVVARAVLALRKRAERVPLVVGNVATAEAARALAGLGVDAIKVGVGPGRGCRTRLETGAGVPQLQAVREAYLATEGPGPDHRRRRGARRQGPLPRHRVRRLHRDAREPALRHRRGPGDGGRGPGHPPEDEALPRHDLAGGGGGRDARTTSSRRRCARRRRGSRSACRTWAAWSASSRACAGTCSRRSATPGSRACAPRTRRSPATPVASSFRCPRRRGASPSCGRPAQGRGWTRLPATSCFRLSTDEIVRRSVHTAKSTRSFAVTAVRPPLIARSWSDERSLTRWFADQEPPPTARSQRAW